MQDVVDRVVAHYAIHGRHDLPWRQPSADGTFDPYAILVSEIMLQQTQVSRVTPKYLAFLQQFPSIQVLAQASLASVLQAWSGLGYNRRAKHLWLAAQVVKEADTFPQTIDALCALPGIGPNTAGAIAAYAFDQPSEYLETNIRTVFIHHLYPEADKVSDVELRPFVHEALQLAKKQGLSPREWYWALMDYGTYLKQTAGNASRRSAGHSKQSAFEGSKRQVRGRVLRSLGQAKMLRQELEKIIPDPRLSAVLDELQAEELICNQNGWYGLGNVVQS